MTHEEIVALQNTLAHQRRKCPDCKGKGATVFVASGGVQKPAWPCKTCGGSGNGDYLLGDVVRVRCKNWIPAPSGGWNRKPEQTEPFHPGDCPNCHEGTVASNRQEDWEKACLEKGWSVQFEPLKDGTVTCFIDLPNRSVISDPDPDTKVALLLATEKAVTND